MKNTLKKVLIAVVILAIAVAVFLVAFQSEKTASEIDLVTAQEFVNHEFDAMAKTNAAKFVSERNNITVKGISYGEEKDIILDCSVDTIDAYSALCGEYDSFLSANVKKKTMFKSALDFKLEFMDRIVAILADAPEKTEDIQIVLYETKDGLVVYASDDVVNAVYGGIIDVKNEIEGRTTYTVVNPDGTITEKPIETKNVIKGFVECIAPVYEDDKPDTSGAIGKFINKQKKDFHQNFIEYDRWKTIVNGLWITIQITFFALIIGVILGFLVAFIRCAYLKDKKPGFIISFFNAICQLYLTITRGTPVVVQIMILYFVILQPMGVSTFISAFVCFGLNSGAYVAEIVRGGIMSVDEGQMEAGRSLGFNYAQTMWHIIVPQAFKTVLPSLANEFVVLLKETSIAFYIGIGDLMYSALAIRAATYSAFMPLVAAAIIYLVMVLFFSKMVNILERRMRNSER